MRARAPTDRLPKGSKRESVRDVTRTPVQVNDGVARLVCNLSLCLDGRNRGETLGQHIEPRGEQAGFRRMRIHRDHPARTAPARAPLRRHRVPRGLTHRRRLLALFHELGGMAYTQDHDPRLRQAARSATSRDVVTMAYTSPHAVEILPTPEAVADHHYGRGHSALERPGDGSASSRVAAFPIHLRGGKG